MDRIEVSLTLLRELAAARLAGDEPRAVDLSLKLLEWDYAHGYRDHARGDRALLIAKHGEKHTGTPTHWSRHKRFASGEAALADEQIERRRLKRAFGKAAE
jgi:hypothetical protein